MPVINGVYLKDFAALPGSVDDANIIPIAISGNQVAYRTTVAGIITDARITSKLLTGLIVTGGSVVATDTILEAFGKVQNQINNRVNSGGSSVNYYLNGSVPASVATYYQMDNTPVIGTGTDFPLVGNGLIAQFLTDANNPNRLLIPAGAWNFEMYFQVSSAGGNAKFYVELLKYNGSTFTSIASSSAVPEEITNGTTIDLYVTSIAVPETALLITDRLAIRVYIVDNSGGRTVTLHTEDNTLCQIVTTFAGGISALNGLTANTQYFAVGSTGTDFNIVSSVDTHTFNIPDASDTARGLITTGAQTIAGSKTFSTGYINLDKSGGSNWQLGDGVTALGEFSLYGVGYDMAYWTSRADGSTSFYGQVNAVNYTGDWNGTPITDSYISSAATWNAKQNALSGTGIVKSTAGVISYLTDPLPIANGGTGSATKNFVDLTTNQTIGGDKTFSGNSMFYYGFSIATGGSSPSATISGSTSIQSLTLSRLFISKTSSNGGAIFDLSNISGANIRTFSLPDATGTLALTSDIHSAVTLSAIGSAPNANGATLTGQVLNLEPASASFGGVITTGTQTIAGNKTFTGALIGTSASFVSSIETPVTLTANDGVAQLTLINATNSKNWAIRQVGNDFIIRESGVSDNFTFKAGGGASVFGVTATAFDVGSNDGVVSLRFTNATNAKQWGFRQVGNDFILREPGVSDNITFKAGGGLIGTTASFVGGSSNPLSISVSDGVSSILMTNSTNSKQWALRQVGNDFIIRESGVADRLAVTSAGNVLIGTTTDAGYKLDVNGTGRFSDDVSISGVGNQLSFDTTGATATSIIKTVEDYKLSLKSNRGNTTEIKIGDADLEFLTNNTLRLGVGITGSFSFSSNDITQNGTRPIITLQQSGTTKLILGISSGNNDIIFGDVSGDVDFRKNGGSFLFSVDNGTSACFKLASTGVATLSNLAGTGSRMVQASSTGALSASNTLSADLDLSTYTIKSGAVFTGITDVGGNFTVSSTMYTVRVSTAGGAATATLPDAATNTGRILIIGKYAGGSNVTIQCAGSDTFAGGATSQTITTIGEFYTIQSNSQWVILNQYIP